MAKTFTRIAVAGASLALVYAGSTPAWAADAGVQWENKVISLSGGRGDMAFHDDGDVFEVCDTKADGAGVTGYVYERNPVTLNVRLVRSVSDGGDAGCGESCLSRLIDLLGEIRSPAFPVLGQPNDFGC